MKRRAAFTLLEVILAFVILVGALAVVGRLVELSSRSALYARFQTRAIQLAESKMNEVVAGLWPLEPTSNQTFEEDPDYVWRLDVVDGPITGLKLVRIVVEPAPGGLVAQSGEPIRFELTRYVLDPEYVATVAVGGEGEEQR